ncbi:MAG: hypothetical protein ACKODZ_05675 [Verrucomicrobiota bacterium]
MILDRRSGGAGTGAERAEINDFNRLDFLRLLAGGKGQTNDGDQGHMDPGDDQDGAP